MVHKLTYKWVNPDPRHRNCQVYVFYKVGSIYVMFFSESSLLPTLDDGLSFLRENVFSMFFGPQPSHD